MPIAPPSAAAQNVPCAHLVGSRKHTSRSRSVLDRAADNRLARSTRRSTGASIQPWRALLTVTRRYRPGEEHVVLAAAFDDGEAGGSRLASRCLCSTRRAAPGRPRRRFDAGFAQTRHRRTGCFRVITVGRSPGRWKRPANISRAIVSSRRPMTGGTTATRYRGWSPRTKRSQCWSLRPSAFLVTRGAPSILRHRCRADQYTPSVMFTPRELEAPYLPAMLRAAAIAVPTVVRRQPAPPIVESRCERAIEALREPHREEDSADASRPFAEHHASKGTTSRTTPARLDDGRLSAEGDGVHGMRNPELVEPRAGRRQCCLHRLHGRVLRAALSRRGQPRDRRRRRSRRVGRRAEPLPMLGEATAHARRGLAPRRGMEHASTARRPVHAAALRSRADPCCAARHRGGQTRSGTRSLRSRSRPAYLGASPSPRRSRSTSASCAPLIVADVIVEGCIGETIASRRVISARRRRWRPRSLLSAEHEARRPVAWSVRSLERSGSAATRALTTARHADRAAAVLAAGSPGPRRPPSSGATTVVRPREGQRPRA